ncbi:hypothetical protein A2524_00615 [Candidatus Wolfebacteria bacterium RIFOXYD12_FULL_48_21]|uniref:Glycosyl transferase family 11 n=1 Tax=Candidatus Wolfebacteria bacterium RIFOXYD1_FULL_48_65 TaxID=1802561 RepID=A0A1F8DZE2_9BACT|nr:MAG: hypothetical protein A2610_00320 [Candidatus Wolfebacteria bacterium RIFOXYD1_FULL_48_65]OGM94318.1 MAG: hypothetical protein A2524_00615 [Candidatus Wolfebacteria bacterium RIFOXYD12_FULL_48_21]OGM95884.1 MAG: hypothetical protein A2532_02455 [Candidatus Wolfebacteria bacterium RIFOXYD2_FULL_48_11]
MIIIKLKGGLGNQMFQYACAKHLAERNGDVLKLDISLYQPGNAPAGDTARSYALGAFSISAQVASKEEVRRVRGLLWHIMALAMKVINRVRPISSYMFDPQVLERRGNVYLDGYFQSERYFKDIKACIRNEFRLREPMGEQAQAMLRDIDGSDSVSLHIRRGDYVTNKNANAFHGTCPPEYYHAAIKEIGKHVHSPKFFIFSDDIEWAKADVGMPAHATYVSRDGIADYEELLLMSKCKHNIIANSSFSWWGAWLNANSNKIVVAPKRWINDERVDTSDAVPVEWVSM